MKSNLCLLYATLLVPTVSSHGQAPLVGSGSPYGSIFSHSSSVTYDVPGGGLLSITLANGSANTSSGLWDLAAQGGANASILLSLTESAAQTSLTGSSLQFNVSNDNDSLLGLLGGGASVHYAWSAEAYFDTPGNVLGYTPFTSYHVSFNVDGNEGLLSSVAGLTPQFSFELIDGSGNALASSSSGTQINIAGLLGTGVTSGTVNLDYIVDGTVPAGPIGVRFLGDALVGPSALSLGTNFATISDLNITATPVPEPGGAALVGAVGVLILLRRRRAASRC